MQFISTEIPDVFVRTLTTAELFELQDLRGAEGMSEAKASRAFGVALMRMCAVREDGSPVWEDDAAVLAMPAPDFLAQYEPLCAAALKANGLDAEDDDEGNA